LKSRTSPDRSTPGRSFPNGRDQEPGNRLAELLTGHLLLHHAWDQAGRGQDLLQVRFSVAVAAGLLEAESSPSLEISGVF
jgi:hypothetical protein